MSRTIGVLVAGLAVVGFVSMAAAAPLAIDIAVKISQRDLVVQVDFKCRKVDGKLVCGSTKGNKNRDDDDDDDKPKKSKDKVIPKTCGKKVNCEVGYVKLSKPNKYGACCEAREGLPPAKQHDAGQSPPPAQGSSSGGIKEVEPADGVLLPYFECDLSKGEPCKPKQ